MEQDRLERIRVQLVDRRQRLNQVVSNPNSGVHYANLLREVDAALERIDNGSYGICVVCQGEIEHDRLMVNPLITVCLDDLDTSQRKYLEADLDLARRIQTGMLPQNNLSVNGWEVSFHYEPAGAVSGDYCDIISAGDSLPEIFFILGDVSGKGIAASMLMSHLHAMFHSMVPLRLTVTELVEHASSLMCESTISSHYATLLCIKADNTGKVEICNAGHLPPLLVKKGNIKKINATGVPVGLFCNTEYTIDKFVMEAGDTLLLYTDGLTETFFNEEEYGIERLTNALHKNYSLPPGNLIKELLRDADDFSVGSTKKDDLTIMAIRKL
jgi:sigma-B regulation protein RsbU (phosphoserine phosphatase)